jgi:chemotaxis protein histidine kinase CheA
VITTTATSRLAELQERFLVGLDRRLADLKTSLNGAADAEALMRMFHSLVGIGGTYGFPRISELARRGEEACCRSAEELRSLSPTERQALRQLVASIGEVT